MSRICLARAAGGATPYAAIADATATGCFDRAHVLVPPGLHASAAEPLLLAGIPVLLEKPRAADSAQCDAPGAERRAFNVVDEVRATIRHYVTDIGTTMGRPSRFYPQSPIRLWLVDMATWLVNRATGREMAMPARRDFLSCGMASAFDVTDTKQALGWAPVANPAAGFGCAFAVQVLPE